MIPSGDERDLEILGVRPDALCAVRRENRTPSERCRYNSFRAHPTRGCAASHDGFLRRADRRSAKIPGNDPFTADFRRPDREVRIG
jgi:hypothetical protein